MSTLLDQHSSRAHRKGPSKAAGRTRRIPPGSALEEKLVSDHLRLVRTVVGRLAMNLPAHVDADDLYSAGLVGLLNAVRQYDPNAGSTFESYARVRIRGAIFDELRRLDWVPRSVHEKARKVQAVMHELEQRNGSLPTGSEMARALSISLSEYEALLDEIRPATFVCLDSVGNCDETAEGGRYDHIPDESQRNPVDCTCQRELAEIVAERLQQLPEVQRKVVALYYFEDMRLREIAQVFGVTESRICQIHSQAILAIRSVLSHREK